MIYPRRLDGKDGSGQQRILASIFERIGDAEFQLCNLTTNVMFHDQDSDTDTLNRSLDFMTGLAQKYANGAITKETIYDVRNRELKKLGHALGKNSKGVAAVQTPVQESLQRHSWLVMRSQAPRQKRT